MAATVFEVGGREEVAGALAAEMMASVAFAAAAMVEVTMVAAVVVPMVARAVVEVTVAMGASAAVV